MPMPGNPACENEVLSVPPRRRLLLAMAPATPRSAKGATACAQNVTIFGRTEDAETAHASGAGIDIEVAVKLCVFGLGIFKGPEVLFHVCL